MELILNTIPEDSDHLKLYSFVKKIFLLLDQEIDPEVISFIFELKLLYFLGYGLNFKECNICSSKENLVFSTEHGGLICSEHLTINQHSYGPLIYVNIMTLYFIDINKTEIPKLERNDKTIIRHILDILYADYVGYKTKSRGIIKQIQKY
jgi:DNA repair protein RecO (recombination protein O)